MRVDIKKLNELNQMAKEGASNVAENLSQMLGIDVEMSVTRIEFINLQDIPETIGDHEVVGVYLTFDGTPSGYLLALFPTNSAKNVASLLLEGIGENNSSDFSDMDISAIGEVGNIITSSFIDGWADFLKTEISISTPQTVHDMGSAVIDPLLIQVAQEYDNAFLFNSLIHTKNNDISCELFVIPEITKLMEAVENV